MTEETDFISEWARIQRSLKDARKAVLKTMGHTESSLRDVQDKALAQMTQDLTETEFGPVQRTFLESYLHKGLEPIRRKPKLTLLSTD